MCQSLFFVCIIQDFPEKSTWRVNETERKMAACRKYTNAYTEEYFSFLLDDILFLFYYFCRESMEQ